MAISIEDVAKRAQVSISTVSRVLNGRNVVNVKTRERVEAAIDELGYRPNIFVRGLMLRKSHTLGLVLPDLHGEFYSEIIRGANIKARESGYHLLVASVDKDDEGQEVMQAIGDHGLVDGVAVMISELDAHSKATLSHISIPFVVLDGPVEGVMHDTVMIDQRQGTFDLVRHLTHAGVRRLIFVGGRQQNIDTIQRLAACEEVLEGANLTLSDEDTFFLDYDFDTAYQLAGQHIRFWAGPDSCVFAANDEMAAGVIQAATGQGISVPRELRVVGFDDTRLAQMIRPRLTTVHVPMAAMGAAVVDLLCRRLEEPTRDCAVVVLKSSLVVRESCGALRRESAH